MNPAASGQTIALYPEKHRLLKGLQFYRLLAPTPVVVVDDQERPLGQILADDVLDMLVPDRPRFRFPRRLS